MLAYKQQIEPGIHTEHCNLCSKYFMWIEYFMVILLLSLVLLLLPLRWPLLFSSMHSHRHQHHLYYVLNAFVEEKWLIFTEDEHCTQSCTKCRHKSFWHLAVASQLFFCYSCQCWPCQCWPRHALGKWAMKVFEVSCTFSLIKLVLFFLSCSTLKSTD